MPGDTKKPKKPERRGGTRALASLVPGLTRRAIGKRGFAQASIITDWPMIVGPDLSKHSQPDRLSYPRGERTGGTLFIRAAGPMATELMHLEGMLIDRINSHFGYGAVSAVKLLQVPLRQQKKSRQLDQTAGALSKTDREHLEKTLAGVEDAGLRDVLLRLGSSVLRQKTATKS